MNSLYIFVDSQRPDQYLNPIVHCVLRHDVRKITFLHIEGLTERAGPTRHTRGVSARVMAAMHAQLEGLAERGEYLFNSGSRTGERTLLRDEYSKSRALSIQEYYRCCRDFAVAYTNEELEYAKLRSRLRRIASEGRSAFVDVTAIRKRYLGDVVAAGLVEGLRGLYTFDIKHAGMDFERPWRMLIHDLETQSPPMFEYMNILDTPLYRSCARLVLVRAPKLRAVAAAIAVALVVGAMGYWYLGPQNPIVQTILALSGLASVVSLALFFLAPRE